MNDPVNSIDPTGQIGIFGAVIGGLSGAIGGFSSALISGNSWQSAVAGGVVGGITGAAVGSLNVFAASTAGQAAGAIVGGLIGGGVAGGLSNILDTGEVNKGTLGAIGKGMAAGGFTAAISAPGIGLAAIGGSTATSLAGGMGGIIGDLIYSTAFAIYNNIGNGSKVEIAPLIISNNPCE